MPRMREDGCMTTRTACLAIIPVAVALLAGAALPFQSTTLVDAPGHPLGNAAAGAIIALAVLLLRRVPAAAVPRRGKPER